MTELETTDELQAIETYLNNFDGTLLERGVFPADLDKFKVRLHAFLAKLPKKQQELALENRIKEFLHPSMAELKGVVDTDKQHNFDVAVRNDPGEMISLMECKHAHNKTEMLSMANLNCKALQQALLYYITAVKVENSLMLKDTPKLQHIIITNGYEWFWLAQKDLHALVLGDKAQKFEHQGEHFTLLEAYAQITTNAVFYKVAGSFIAQHEEKLRAIIHPLNLQNINFDHLTDQQWSVLYHLFSPAVLLNHQKVTDANTLNKRFYKELLHIMGLREVKQKSLKEVPEGKETDEVLIIVPNPAAVNSLYDQVNKRLANEGLSGDELFEKTLTIIILWINRLLFLKLLEAHIVNAHINPHEHNDEAAWAEYGFMAVDKITNGHLLYDLFFDVLAKKWGDRNERLRQYFAHVPYLNSSLFALDKKTEPVDISALHNEPMTLHKNSVVGGEAALPVLTYLLTFLKTYDFATNGASKKGQNVKALEDRLINASVLGKVFEKLNGYKDGSFFTPSYITTYICRQTIEQALVSRSNAALPQMATPFVDYDDLKKTFERWGNNRKTDYMAIVQEIIKTLTVVDPAVGSGHFLVSALNELLRIRHDFDLMDGIGYYKTASLTVMNDEIIIRRNDSSLVYYYVGDLYTQRVQEELFFHKQQIIENNLFGVDINANSVSICHLRLWIELLKNSYYKRSPDEKKANLVPTLNSEGNNEMETLPNIDINIKVGNSLVSKLPVHDDHELSKKELELVKRYTQAVQEYKHATKNKREVIAELEEVKKSLYFAFEQHELFTDPQAQDNKNTQEQTLYANAIEWRMAFPEVLDAKGKFKGFDVVVANPPYGVKLTPLMRSYLKKTFTGNSSDTAAVFMSLMPRLLTPRGKGGFIIPKAFTYASNWAGIRQVIVPKLNLLIDCGKVWEQVKLEMVLYLFANEVVCSHYQTGYRVDETLHLHDHSVDKATMLEFGRLLNNVTQEELNLARKIKSDNAMLNDFVTNHRGSPLQKFVHKSDGAYRVLGGKQLNRYGLKPEVKGFMHEEDTQRDDSFIIHPNALLVQRMIAHVEKPFPQLKIIGILSEQVHNLSEYGIVDTINQLTNKGQLSSAYLLGLLHSQLINWYLYRFICGKAIRTIQFDNPVSSCIPIALPTPAQQTEVVALVEQIIANKKEGRDSSPLENSLDTLVYKIYNLTLEEMTLIDGVYQQL